MIGHEVTIIIPTISPGGGRASMLGKAIQSAEDQQHAPVEVIVEQDTDREGPAIVRNRAVAKAETEWIAFLDDDDYLLPNHLAVLCQAQSDSGADLLWPWFTVEGGSDPFPMFRGRQWDPGQPHIFPITVLLRKEAFDAVGGFLPSRGQHPDGHETGEDFNLWLRLSDAGCRFHHVPDRSWVWRHHGANTSGLPSRW